MRSRVVAKFQEQGYDPEGYTLYTYAAIQAWARAVEKAGSTDLDAVVEALHANQFETVLGTVGFDDKGDVEGRLRHVRVEGRPVRRDRRLSLRILRCGARSRAVRPSSWFPAPVAGPVGRRRTLT